MIIIRYLKYTLVPTSIFFGFILVIIALFFLFYYAIINTQKNSGQLYQQLLVTEGKEEALKDTIAYLKGLPIVKDAGISEMSSSIWVDYVVGIGGAISIDPPGGL